MKIALFGSVFLFLSNFGLTCNITDHEYNKIYDLSPLMRAAKYEPFFVLQFYFTTFLLVLDTWYKLAADNRSGSIYVVICHR